MLIIPGTWVCYPGMWTSFVKIYTQDPGIVTRKHGVISQVVGSISQECELHLLFPSPSHMSKTHRKYQNRNFHALFCSNYYTFPLLDHSPFKGTLQEFSPKLTIYTLTYTHNEYWYNSKCNSHSWEILPTIWDMTPCFRVTIPGSRVYIFTNDVHIPG